MLNLSCFGHATLLVRGGNAAVLCDPIFGDTVSGEGNRVHPPRHIRLARLPPLDAVFISHHHSDHFCPSELARLPEIHELPIFVPRQSPAVGKLQSLGYRVEEIDVGDQIRIKDIGVTATPSTTSFPEMGLLFEHDGASALNLVDTQIHGITLAVRAIADRPTLILAPFQSGGYVSLLPLRVGGPPVGLEAAIRRWANEYMVELAHDLVQLAPQHVASFADGIAYRDGAINHWHFPLPDSAFLSELARSGIAGSVALPGRHYEVRPDRLDHRIDDTYVVAATHAPVMSRAFDPSCRISDFPFACVVVNADLPTSGLGRTSTFLERLQTNFLTACSALNQMERQHLFALCAGWFLELCDVANGDRFLVVEPSAGRPVVSAHAERPEGRPYGIRAHWSDLQAVAERRVPIEYIKLSGAFRYFSPLYVDALEAIRERVFAPLDALLDTHATLPSQEWTTRPPSDLGA